MTMEGTELAMAAINAMIPDIIMNSPAWLKRFSSLPSISPICPLSANAMKIAKMNDAMSRKSDSAMHLNMTVLRSVPRSLRVAISFSLNLENAIVMTM